MNESMTKVLGVLTGVLAFTLVVGCEISNLDDVSTEQAAGSSSPSANQPNNSGNSSENTPASNSNNNPAPAPAPSSPPPASSAGLGTRGEGGGFLWKPTGENSGKLVVLLPPQYSSRATGAFIATGSGSVVERGAYSGIHNGGRRHYRFSKSGRDYGSGIYVVADLNNGTSVHWPIANGASRTGY